MAIMAPIAAASALPATHLKKITTTVKAQFLTWHLQLDLNENTVKFVCLKVYDNAKNVDVSSTKSRHPNEIDAVAWAKTPII